jgi:acetyl-CoA hydrolase
MARAQRVIENCAHPAYRDTLLRYIEKSPMGHIRHDLRHCFDMHLNYLEEGAMVPGMDLSSFASQGVVAK